MSRWTTLPVAFLVALASVALIPTASSEHRAASQAEPGSFLTIFPTNSRPASPVLAAKAPGAAWNGEHTLAAPPRVSDGSGVASPFDTSADFVLSVVVTSPYGPVGAATVSLVNSTGVTVKSGTTNPQGDFTFIFVAGGAYDVNASAVVNYPDGGSSGVPISNSTRVLLEGNGTTATEFALASVLLSPPNAPVGLTIAATGGGAPSTNTSIVADVEGTPPPQATISWLADGNATGLFGPVERYSAFNQTTKTVEAELLVPSANKLGASNQTVLAKSENLSFGLLPATTTTEPIWSLSSTGEIGSTAIGQGNTAWIWKNGSGSEFASWLTDESNSLGWQTSNSTVEAITGDVPAYWGVIANDSTSQAPSEVLMQPGAEQLVELSFPTSDLATSPTHENVTVLLSAKAPEALVADLILATFVTVGASDPLGILEGHDPGFLSSLVEQEVLQLAEQGSLTTLTQSWTGNATDDGSILNAVASIVEDLSGVEAAMQAAAYLSAIADGNISFPSIGQLVFTYLPEVVGDIVSATLTPVAIGELVAQYGEIVSVLTQSPIQAVFHPIVKVGASAPPSSGTPPPGGGGAITGGVGYNWSFWLLVAAGVIIVGIAVVLLFARRTKAGG